MGGQKQQKQPVNKSQLFDDGSGINKLLQHGIQTPHMNNKNDQIKGRNQA